MNSIVGARSLKQRILKLINRHRLEKMSSLNTLTNPESLGFDPIALNRIQDRIKTDINAEKYDGGRFLMARRGKLVLDLTLGYQERDSKRPMREDAIFSIMSISKALTATGLLRCIERGEVSMLTPVHHIIPEFAKRGKERVTVGHILTHTAGLGMAPAPIPVPDLMVLEKSVAAICEMPLETPPGEIVSYSAMTGYTILAEVIRRLDAKKRSFRAIMAEDVFEPLKMKDTSFGIKKELSERRVPVAVRDFDSPELNHQYLMTRDKSITETTELAAGGGGFASAQDILRFAEALRLGGALEGGRVLSPAMVQLMTSNHTGLRPNSMMNNSRALHGLAPFPAYLGLGLFLRGEGVFPSHIPTLASAETFGSWGLGSMGFWVDPQREITFVSLTSGIMERIRSHMRFQMLGDMALSSLID